MKVFGLVRNLAIHTSTRSVDKIVHLPVLAKQITETLNPQDGQHFIDLTFGGGGHTKHLLSTNKQITIFALDRDPEAFERAIVLAKKVSSKNNGQKVIPLLGRFSELETLLANFDVPENFFNGAIMDLGASSFQFETLQRGFSINLDGPLDMRMDANRFPNMPTAADVVNGLDAEDLVKIFKIYGEERHAVKIAHSIVDSRFLMKRLNTTRELATLVASTLNTSYQDKLGRYAHPATKIFQALRIFVNNELNELNYGIHLLSKYLKINQSAKGFSSCDIVTTDEKDIDGGLLAAISFHSLEDKIVKNNFVGLNSSMSKWPMNSDYNVMAGTYDTTSFALDKKWILYKDKLIYPSADEVDHNPRARSAKLRFGLRI